MYDSEYYFTLLKVRVSVGSVIVYGIESLIIFTWHHSELFPVLSTFHSADRTLGEASKDISHAQACRVTW